MSARYEVRYGGYHNHVVMRAVTDNDIFQDMGQMSSKYDALRVARLLQEDDARIGRLRDER